MSLFKKKDEDRKTIRPKLRPANFGSDPKERKGSGGKGKGGEATPKYDVTASDWSEQVAKFNAKGGINNDGRFGYGYVDTQTGIEVPWYIDMINGGGANAAGDTFVSPFEGTMAGLPAQAITGGLNAMGVAPYGSNRPRYFMPMEAARVDAEGKPVQVDLGPAPRPTGGGSPAVTPTVDNSQNGDAGEYRSMDQAVGGYQYPSMYRPMDRQVGLFQQYQASPSPNLSDGTTMGVAQIADMRLARQEAVGNRPVSQDDMPAILSFGGGERPPLPAMTPSNIGVGNRPSDPTMATPPVAMTMFTARMNTVPEMLRGTRIEEMYRKYLLSGNTGNFDQFTGAQP